MFIVCKMESEKNSNIQLLCIHLLQQQPLKIFYFWKAWANYKLEFT